MIDRVSGTRSPLGCSVLALNRMYMAVHVVPVRRAFCLLCKGTAEVVSVENGSWMAYDFGSWLEISELRAAMGEFDEHEDWIRSVSFDVQVPRVIRLLKYDRVPRNSVKFTRRNVFLRDDYTCQYCHKRFTVSNLSLDHVVPRSQSGKSTWDNIVTACLTCNVKKGGRTPEQARMFLKRQPSKPRQNPVLAHQMKSPVYECWRSFLGQQSGS